MVDGKNAHSDVLVIGSGAAGAALTRRLAEAGVSVTCLEQGDWIHPAMHPHNYPEWEIEKQRGWNWDPNQREHAEDYPVTGRTWPLMMNTVGGSSLHYVAVWHRLRPADFRKSTEHGLMGTIDWPIGYDDLAPYYDEHDALVGISGLDGDPSLPPRAPRHGPPVAPGRLGIIAAKAFDQLGWHWWPTDNAILTNTKDGRLPCNACGNCSSGCPRGSMSTPNVTQWPAALSAGARLIINARVEQITLNNQGKAKGAVYVDRITGERKEVTADIVALSANGVGSPRLLLLSSAAGSSQGLANSSGLVGRHLMHHTWALVDCWLDQPTYGYAGAFGAPLYSAEFLERPADEFVNGFSMHVGLSYGAATAAMGFHSGAVVPWGSQHREVFDRRFGQHVMFSIQGEDLPDPDNRVMLDSEAPDSSGLPGAKIHYEIGDNDAALTQFGIERAIEVGQAAGAVEYNNSGLLDPPPAWHLLGTCRMGSSPEDSVVNKVNQTWDIPNLFIVDGSSMTTCGGVNPTSTIGALALRCADYLLAKGDEVVRQGKTPANSEIEW